MKYKESRPAESASYHLTVALKYFNAAYKALKGGSGETKLTENVLKGKTLTYLEMDLLDKALENAKMFINQVTIRFWFVGV